MLLGLNWTISMPAPALALRFWDANCRWKRDTTSPRNRKHHRDNQWKPGSFDDAAYGNHAHQITSVSDRLPIDRRPPLGRAPSIANPRCVVSLVVALRFLPKQLAASVLPSYGWTARVGV